MLAVTRRNTIRNEVIWGRLGVQGVHGIVEEAGDMVWSCNEDGKREDAEENIGNEVCGKKTARKVKKEMGGADYRKYASKRRRMEMTHISSLPMEIVLYILRWVVSADLDIRSLELCSRVSRGFYLCSRDSEIWRLACIRFFPEGVVLMLTTPDDPITSLAHLRQRTPRNPAVLTGHYRLHEDRVIMVLKKHGTQGKISGNNRYRARHNRETSSDLEEQNYHLSCQSSETVCSLPQELQINSYRNRLHSQLAWQGYSIFMKLRNGAESTSKFELPTNRYPPFWFSRVKSYTAESENPLQ
uniref:F-box domain-containing protein n=1 Tax=Timema bartmani TaxID=61472 RepID=A0A7R9I4T4_9NEOP|nr:unnamed protein product [Timema bartmani]